MASSFRLFLQISEYAAAKGIEFIEYLADWERAGFVRNYAMVGAADAVIAVWDETSSGTKHSIELALSSGKPVFVYTPNGKRAELAASA